MANMLTALIQKELLALRRDAHGLAALFLMPLVFIVVMSLALKNVYNPLPVKLIYSVQNLDQGELAQSFINRWQAQHGPAHALPTPWEPALRLGQLKYVLVLQKGLSDELESPTLPTSARIQLRTEPGLDQHLFNSLRSELVGLSGEIKARTALANTDAPAPPENASMLALVDAQRLSSDQRRSLTSVQQNVPAWLVFGMFFVVTSMSNLLLQERRCGTLARLRSLGVGHPMLLASKGLPYLAVNGAQAVLMLAVGVWIMPLLGGDALSLVGVHWSALLATLISVSLAAVSLALVLACLVRSESQAAAVGPILNVLMAAIGGIMVPKLVMPTFMQRLAEFSPMNWGMEAMLTVLVRQGDLASVWPNLATLLGFAASMLALAWGIFRRA